MAMQTNLTTWLTNVMFLSFIFYVVWVWQGGREYSRIMSNNI